MRRGVVVFALLLLFSTGARADGDPASDTLLVKNVFLPYPTPSTAAAARLAREVAASYVRGFRVKVAVIATESDLGAIPSLFNRPGDYAKFLGQELQLYYVGPLLIVMPSGYGIYDGGRSTALERRILAGAQPSGPSADELTKSAAATIRRLVSAGALKSKDVKAPYVAALAATVTAGRTARLNYSVFDDSGKTRERLAVRDRSGHAIATWAVGLRTTNPTKTYSVAWHVPASVPRKRLKFCVTAYDPSGNQTRPNCARVIVKP